MKIYTNLKGPSKKVKGPFIGYRAWLVDYTPRGKTRLASVGSGHTLRPAYEGGPELARDTHGCGRVMGYYAFARPEMVSRGPWFGYPVWGEVYLWGEVVVCLNGYRAQYMYPKKLYGFLAPDLAREYGCEGFSDAMTWPRRGTTTEYTP